jgi:uncharacterized membrane protein YtjA (UPF0391 family)
MILPFAVTETGAPVRRETVMFTGAIASLMIAVVAALFGYGGVPDATAATVAQHVFLIAIGLFVVSALVTILDVELPHGRLVPLIRSWKVDPKSPTYSDTL